MSDDIIKYKFRLIYLVKSIGAKYWRANQEDFVSEEKALEFLELIRLRKSYRISNIHLYELIGRWKK